MHFNCKLRGRPNRDLIPSQFFLAVSLGQLPLMPVVCKFGARRALTSMALSWWLLTSLAGLAQSFFTLFVLRLLLGLACSVLQPIVLLRTPAWLEATCDPTCHELT